MFASKQAFYVFIVQVLALQILFASTSSSQSIKKVMINIHVENARLTEVFHAIEEQTVFAFIYDENVIESRERFFLNFDNTSVAYILKKVGEQSGLNFKQINTNISVTKALEQKSLKQEKRENTPDIAITGKVTDENGEPLPGATISVKGTSIGTVSDVDGNFNLNVPENAVLSVSYVGYQTLEIPVANQTDISISLVGDALGLSEVVVTALGVKREEKQLGYAVQEVKEDELEKVRDHNYLNSLSGRLAGVNIVQGNSGVGSSARVIIRGETSLSSDNQPLFVVDGVPINNFTNPSITEPSSSGPQEVDYGNGASELNPDDIASITVLKGANAAALYGSRAANGVILITTKQGKMTKGLDVTFNFTTTFENVLVIPDWQNRYGQGSGGRFSYEDGLGGGVEDSEDTSWGPEFGPTGSIPQFDGQSVGPDGEVLRGGDWFARRGAPITPTPWLARPDNVKDFFETGVTTTPGIAISGGSEKGDFRLSYTRMDAKGVTPNNDLTRNTFSLKTRYRFNDMFSARITASYLNGESDNRPSMGYGSENPMYAFAWYGRQVDTDALKEYWQRGFEGIQQFNYNSAWHDNPYMTAFENTNGFAKNRLLGNIALNFQFTSELSLMLRTGTDFFYDNRISKRANSTQRFPFGMYREDDVFFQETNSDVLLTYERNTGSEVRFTLSAGANRMHRVNTFTSNIANELSVPGLYTLSNSRIPLVTSQFDTEKRINSIYGLGQIAFREYLFLDITGRNDWSSALTNPDGNMESDNSYFYPSVSISAIASDIFNLPEPFSFVKIRGGYAEVGNDTDPYRLVSVYEFGIPYGSSQTAIEQDDLPNQDLRPERQKSWEIGLDLRLFSGRFNLDATYYNTRSEDQLISLPVSRSSGYASRFVNGGVIRNYGVELMLNSRILEFSNGLTVDIFANFTKNQGKVIEILDDQDDYVYAATAVNTRQEAQVFAIGRRGGTLGDIYGTGFQKTEDGQIIYNWDPNDPNSIPLPIPDPELRLLGNYNPDFTLGSGAKFGWKGLSFDFLFDWRKGGVVVSRMFAIATTAGNTDITAIGREGGVKPDGVYNAGTSENPDYQQLPDNARTPAQTFYKAFYDRNHEESSTFDASFVKLREVKLTCQLPKVILSALPFEAASISLVGRNLKLWTDQGYFDPETLTYEGNSPVPGVEEMAYPSTRSYGFNINVKF